MSIPMGCISPRTFAEQMTYVESTIISKLELDDLHPDSYKTSRNVHMIIEFFNRMTDLIGTVILSQSTRPRRTEALEYFIDVLDVLFELENYDGCMMIICILNTAQIVRLKRAMDCIKLTRMKILSRVEEFMSSSLNYHLYRSRITEIHNSLKNHGDVSASESYDCNVIPYFGLLMQTMIYFNETDSNIDTIAQRELRLFKPDYQISPDDYVISYMMNARTIHTDSQYLISLDQEPRMKRREK